MEMILVKDKYLVSCIAFVYANSKKEALYLQEIYKGIRKHYKNMEKLYKDMEAAVRGIIYHYRDNDYRLFVNVDRARYKISGGVI